MVGHITNKVKISENFHDAKNASHLILPGVGSYASTLRKFKECRMYEQVAKEALESKKPTLGICVGMQIMSTVGDEFGHTMGLDWVPGQVSKISAPKLCLPHIGWNTTRSAQSDFAFLDRKDFYFVHSYAYKKNEFTVATCSYGEEFAAVTKNENIWGAQFHPEKSQYAGFQFLKKFLTTHY